MFFHSAIFELISSLAVIIVLDCKPNTTSLIQGQNNLKIWSVSTANQLLQQ